MIPNNIPEHILLAHQIKTITRLIFNHIPTHSVIYGKGNNQCILLKRDEEFGAGYCWSSDDKHTVYYDFNHLELDKDNYELNFSVRYFAQEDYLYYHPSLSYYTVFRDSGNMSEHITIPMIPYAELNEDILFQYSTMLTEDELSRYQIASYLQSQSVESITLRLKHMNETIDLLLQEQEDVF